MSTHTEFQYSIDMVTIDDENVIEHLGAVVDLQVAFATYRAASRVSPGAHIRHARVGPERRWCARESGRREPVIRYSMPCAQ